MLFAYFVLQAKALTKGRNTAEFVDPKLNREHLDKAFKAVLELALSCMGLKQRRPLMEQVVLCLEKALDLSARAAKSLYHVDLVEPADSV